MENGSSCQGLTAAERLFCELLERGQEHAFVEFKSALLEVPTDRYVCNLLTRIVCLHNARADSADTIPALDTGRAAAFLVVGVDDLTHDLTGWSDSTLTTKSLSTLLSPHIFPAPPIAWIPLTIEGKHCGLVQITMLHTPVLFAKTELTTKQLDNHHPMLYGTRPTRIGTSNTLTPSDGDWAIVQQRFGVPAAEAALTLARQRLTGIGAENPSALRVLLLGPTLFEAANLPHVVDSLSAVLWDVIIDATPADIDIAHSIAGAQELARLEAAMCTRGAPIRGTEVKGKLGNSSIDQLLWVRADAHGPAGCQQPCTVLKILQSGATCAITAAKERKMSAGVFISVDGSGASAHSPSCIQAAPSLACRIVDANLATETSDWACVHLAPLGCSLPPFSEFLEILSNDYSAALRDLLSPLSTTPELRLACVGPVPAAVVRTLASAGELLSGANLATGLDPNSIRDNYLRGGAATASVLSSNIIVWRHAMDELLARIVGLRERMDTTTIKERIRVLTVNHLPTTGASSIVRAVAWRLREDWIAIVVESARASQHLHEQLLGFADDKSNSGKPIWFLVVADNCQLDLRSLEQGATTLLHLRVLVLHVQRRLAFDDSWTAATFQIPPTVSDMEIVLFDNLFVKVTTDAPHLFLWGLVTFLAGYDKISSHLKAIGPNLQTHPLFAQAVWLVKLCCIFQRFINEPLPLSHVPPGIAGDDVLDSVLLRSSTRKTISAPVSDERVLALLFDWANHQFAAPDASSPSLSAVFSSDAAAQCVVQWLRQSTHQNQPEFRVLVDGLLLIRGEFGQRKTKFTEFVNGLFNTNPSTALPLLEAAVEAFPTDPHVRAHLGRLRSHAGQHKAAIADLTQARIMCDTAEIGRNTISTMYGDAARKALLAHFHGSAPLFNETELMEICEEGLSAYAEGRATVQERVNTYAFVGEIKLRTILQARLPKYPGLGSAARNFVVATHLYDVLSALVFENSNRKIANMVLELRQSLHDAGYESLCALHGPSHLIDTATKDFDLMALSSCACAGPANDWTAISVDMRRCVYQQLCTRVQELAGQRLRNRGSMQYCGPLSSDYRTLLALSRSLFPASSDELVKCCTWAFEWTNIVLDLESTLGLHTISSTIHACGRNPVYTASSLALGCGARDPKELPSVVLSMPPAGTNTNATWACIHLNAEPSALEAAARFDGDFNPRAPSGPSVRITSTGELVPIHPEECDQAKEVLLANVAVTCLLSFYVIGATLRIVCINVRAAA